LLDFEKMGFDHLFVDESQEFKNLLYTTRHSQVSGLGSPKGSQRAFNLLLACRTIQRQLGNVDKGITFLSGTTISNSLVELYLLFKYLRPNALERLQIRSFDAWAKVYARKSYEFEFSITNEIKRKERYREFIKVPELAMFYTEITDVVNEQNFNVDKPIVKNHVVNLKPTALQEEFMINLIEFAKTQDGSFINKPFLTENEKKAFMLIATNLAKKMSLDMRLIDEDNPGLATKNWTVS
jgi:N12 class adenine-specific DNA methylase